MAKSTFKHVSSAVKTVTEILSFTGIGKLFDLCGLKVFAKKIKKHMGLTQLWKNRSSNKMPIKINILIT